MAATENDVLEARLSRMEASLRDVERRLAAIEHVDAVAEPVEETSEAIFDFGLIGRSVLIVGGAYLLRALTEVGLIPQRAGIGLGFVYAMAWIVLADRAMQRGRRTAALYQAATAALIASSLIWEATTRFRAFPPFAGSLLAAIAAIALLAVAKRHESNAFAWIAVATTTFTLVGLAIGTGDVLPPAIAAVVIGLVARQASPTLIVISDFFLLAMIGMALLDRAPRLAVEITLVAFAIAWILRPRSIQTAAALFIGLGGASLLAFESLTLAIAWSLMAVVTARLWKLQGTQQAPLWILAATAAAFASNALPIVGVLALVALVLMPAGALYSRLIVLMVVTLAFFACASSLLTTADAGVLAMQRSIILAIAAVLLSFLGRIRPEAAIAARIVLGVAAVKFLFDDFRLGRAATIAAALAAYGIVLVIISRKGESMKRILALVVVIAFPLTAIAAGDAATLYKSKCAMCHGGTGAGDTPMGKKLAVKPLGSADVQKNSDEKLGQVIARGAGKMPAFAGKISNEEIKQLVALVRSFAKK